MTIQSPPGGVILKMERFFAPVEEEFETIEEAIGFAIYCLEYNQAYPICITEADGTPLMSTEDLHTVMVRSQSAPRLKRQFPPAP